MSIRDLYDKYYDDLTVIETTDDRILNTLVILIMQTISICFQLNLKNRSEC